MIYTIEQIQQLITPIAKKYNLKKIWLFGSYARDEANASSDIDLVVEDEDVKDMGLEFVGMMQDFQEVLGKEVDVLTKKQILKKGRRITIDDSFRKDGRLIYHV